MWIKLENGQQKKALPTIIDADAIPWISGGSAGECVFIVWFTDASYSHSFIFLRVFFPLREHFYTPINPIFTARIRVDFILN